MVSSLLATAHARRALALSVLLMMGVGAIAHARPEARPLTAFARVHEAVSRGLDAQAAARGARAALEENARQIDAALQEVAVTERASARVQQASIEQQVSWERVWRRSSRETLASTAGKRRDTARLLAAAEPHAHAARLDEHAVLRAHGQGRERALALIFAQSALGVSLAQHEARAQTAAREREGAEQRARQATATQIDADLRRTEQALARELSLLLRNEDPHDFHRHKGTFIHPVKAKPTHGFGPRKQGKSASYVRHTGYTYAVPVGTQVRAVAPGLVVYAGRFEGFGQVVILDHGSGYHTLYAHLSVASVAPSSRVERGATIGASGESGSFEGPQLYFELRKDGLPVNPDSWLMNLR